MALPVTCPPPAEAYPGLRSRLGGDRPRGTADLGPASLVALEEFPEPGLEGEGVGRFDRFAAADLAGQFTRGPGDAGPQGAVGRTGAPVVGRREDRGRHD